MPEQYKYEALTEDGDMRTGVISAVDSAHVEQFLDELHLRPVKIDVLGQKRAFTAFGFLSGSQYEQLIMFTNSLATLHRAGIPLLRALSIIKVGPRQSRFNLAVEQIRIGVQAGHSLSEAMADHDDLFSPVYVASVAAGEESGRLEATLEELSTVLEAELELTRQVKTATRYPVSYTHLTLPTN